MLFPKALHVLSLLAFTTSLPDIICSPVAPQPLGERLAFDLNELPRNVEQAASQEMLHPDPLSSAREVPLIGSSSGAFQPYSARQFPQGQTQDYERPPGEASTNSFPALDRSSSRQHAYVPNIFYQPPLVQPHVPQVGHDTALIGSDDGRAANFRSAGSADRAVNLLSHLRPSAQSIWKKAKSMPDTAPPGSSWSASLDASAGPRRYPYLSQATQPQEAPTASSTRIRAVALGEASSSRDTRIRSLQGLQTVQRGKRPFIPSYDLDLNSAAAEVAEGSHDASKSGNAVIEMALRDPRVFSGAFFRLSLGFDPQVTRLVDSLKSAEAGGELTAAQREFVQGKIPMPIEKFFATYFSRRKFAKQVLLSNENGARSIFLFPFTITMKRYQPVDGFEEYVAAWEIGQVDQTGTFDMHFYGFYPFPRNAFRDLELRPQSTHESYFFFAPSATTSDKPMTLVISRIGSEVNINSIGGIAAGHEGDPSFLTLVDSGRVQRALASSTNIPGRYLAVAQEYPVGERGPMKEWIESSGLSQEAFIQRRLIPPQIDELPFVTELRFRKAHKVKVITDRDGKTYMLDFAAGRQSPGLMTMWEFGPELDEGRKRRLLLLKAYFATDQTSFDHLRPDTVPGLRDARFQYSSMQGAP